MSQDLIKQLLVAEKKAEELIADAKKNRLTKLRQAKDKAEEELKDFRAKEEAKFDKEAGAKAKLDPAAALQSETSKQLAGVERDYQTNKDRAISRVVGKVLEVQLTLSETQAQALRMGMV
eukprot:TRINITY_DN123293_c0_g1_i1.p1 TRINITY_DN123293_c0_g1~~TRINITY_DN123293_c0_g1_i1.p1  ORF type:complete len:120 (+),score=63.90 TRINITY_DN123293_c0_g1_i1:72-431(+)